MKHNVLLLILLFVFYYTKAQVPVSKEPRHRPVFENKNVRILNVLLPPGDTTQYHLHALPSVFLCFSKTITGAQLMGKEPTQSTSSVSYTWFENLSPPHSKVHRVWNVDTTVFHVMDVELLATDSGFTTKPLVLPHLKLVIDTPWTRAYNINLKNNETTSIPNHQSPLLLVAVKSSKIELMQKGLAQIKNVKAGTFFWIPAGEKIAIRNRQNTPAHFALFEVH